MTTLILNDYIIVIINFPLAFLGKVKRSGFLIFFYHCSYSYKNKKKKIKKFVLFLSFSSFKKPNKQLNYGWVAKLIALLHQSCHFVFKLPNFLDPYSNLFSLLSYNPLILLFPLLNYFVSRLYFIDFKISLCYLGFPLFFLFFLNILIIQPRVRFLLVN